MSTDDSKIQIKDRRPFNETNIYIERQGFKKLETPEMLTPLEGLLQKFTNVVKGFQYRYFVTNPISGFLEYYLAEDNYRQKQKPRNAIYLGDAIISPSEEDSCTFTIHSSNGEFFKIKALDARERQVWVNRLRAIAEHHLTKKDQPSSASCSTSKMNTKIPSTSSDFLSNIFNFDNLSKNLTGNKVISAELVQSNISVPSSKVPSQDSDTNMLPPISLHSENQLNAVQEVLWITERHYNVIKDIIDALPPQHNYAIHKSYEPDKDQDRSLPKSSLPSTSEPGACHILGALDPDLLLLKASTLATVNSLKSCLSILEHSYDMGCLNNVIQPVRIPIQSSQYSSLALSTNTKSLSPKPKLCLLPKLISKPYSVCDFTKENVGNQNVKNEPNKPRSTISTESVATDVNNPKKQDEQRRPDSSSCETHSIRVPKQELAKKQEERY